MSETVGPRFGNDDDDDKDTPFFCEYGETSGASICAPANPTSHGRSKKAVSYKTAAATRRPPPSRLRLGAAEGGAEKFPSPPCGCAGFGAATGT